ncbi:MAG: DUF1211 domain-containing protein [Planctomycetes bacterium]|nr:DUF1211 domain-containing protein [Planctomycetota bacterium]
MDLASLPVKNGFRLRGESISRLETFVDAAFAIARTMLVISVGSLPSTMDELFEALKRIPTFGVCFVLMCLFWSAHNKWSRRYGMDDGFTTFLSLALVFVTLVFVFPLRVVMSSALSFFTGGFLPADITLRSQEDLQGSFRVYGLGWIALSLLLWLLFRHALRKADELRLDDLERIETRRDLRELALMIGVGTLSVALTFAVRETSNVLLAALPGFVYSLVGVGQFFIHGSLNREREHIGRPR